jgi:hypothetical protein
MLQEHGHISVKGIEFVWSIELDFCNPVVNMKNDGRHSA